MKWPPRVHLDNRLVSKDVVKKPDLGSHVETVLMMLSVNTAKHAKDDVGIKPVRAVDNLETEDCVTVATE